VIMLGDCVSLRILLVTLCGCRHLDGLVQRGLSSGGMCLSSTPIVVIVRCFLTFSRWRAKRYSSRLLVACGSPSCVGCAAPDCGLDV
jgi:hypothetical protein